MKNRIVGLIVVLGGVLLSGVVVRAVFYGSHPTLRFRANTTTFLGAGDLVKYNGVKIGQLEEFKPSQGGIQWIAALESEVCVPKNASIVVGRAGLLGEREVQISSHRAGEDCYAETDVIEIKAPENEGRNPWMEWVASPEKMDTIIAILRRLEESRTHDEKR